MSTTSELGSTQHATLFIQSVLIYPARIFVDSSPHTAQHLAPILKHVGLVIKTSGDPLSLKKLYEEGVRQSGCTEWPKIAIYGDCWSDEKMRQLHLDCDCWVDATRGEGFGLPQLDAAAMGNPVITTGWGAQIEIVDDPQITKALVPYELIPVDPKMAKIGVYDENQQWANPDLSALAKAMQEAVFSQWNKRISQADCILKEYGEFTIGARLNKLLERVKYFRNPLDSVKP